MAKRGKKYLEAVKLYDRTKKYSLEEAVELVKKTNIAKFDATVEVAFRLNIDPRKAEQNLRGAVSLPHGTGKTVRVLVIAKSAKAQEALAAGADYAGALRAMREGKKLEYTPIEKELTMLRYDQAVYEEMGLKYLW